MANKFISYKLEISKSIKDFFSDLSNANTDKPWVSDVTNRLSKFNQLGKFIRGSLFMLSVQMYGYKKTDDVLKIAAAIEILQGSILIHDDIIDKDKWRRGQPSMHAQYETYGIKEKIHNPVSFSENMAICAGDCGIFWAFDMLSTLNLKENIKSKVISLISSIFADVCLGEMEDIYLSKKNKIPTKEEIIKCFTYKTARYTFSLPLMLGAILSKKDQNTIKQVDDLGILLGMIFQIKDDELGLFGDKNQIGKPVGADISEGKKTLYYYYISQMSSPSKWAELKELFGKKPITQKEIDIVRKTIKDYGIYDQVNLVISDYIRRAKINITKLPVSKAYQLILLDLLFLLYKRSK